MDDPTKDTIPRSAVEYCLRKETVNTNPDAYEAHGKFIAYMDDPDISQFGHWMHSNGFNCALTTVKCDLDKIPSAQPEPCKDVQHILDYLDEVLHPLVSPEHWNVYSELHDMIAELPSTQPERKKGRWVRKERNRGGFRLYTGIDEQGETHTIQVDERTHGYDLYCSECGMLCSDVSLNFCSNCGADMRKEGDK